LEEILYKYLDTWPQDLSYHNILRQTDIRRLTGVMMVKNDIYYTNEFKKCQQKYYDMNQKMNDELTLCKMCKEIHGLPDIDFNYRPILGIHFSPNRGTGKTMPLKTSKLYYDTFLNIVNKYQDIFKYDIFNNLLNQLNNDFNII